MILINEGRVTIQGHPVIVLAELGTVIKAVHDNMKKVAGEEAADRLIAYIGRLALDPDYKEEQNKEKENAPLD